MNFVTVLSLIVSSTLVYSAPLIFTALGGTFSENSGIVNVGLEGIMTMGAFTSIVFNLSFASTFGTATPWLGALLGGIVGIIFSLLHAVATVNCRADHVISGTVLNLMAPPLAVFLVKAIYNKGQTENINQNFGYFSFPGLANIPVIGPIFFKNTSAPAWVAIVLSIFLYWVLYKTRFGLRLRACGEHPQAADSVGINVYKMRYAGVILSGALGAIGGLAYIVPPVQTWNFEVGVAGAGFLALAVMIFGQWKPFHIFGAAMFFAVFKSLANIADSTFLAQLHWSSNIYNMMPFVASMVILAFTSKNSMAPKAEGIPYDKGSR